MVLPIVGLTDVIEHLEFYLAWVWADELIMNIRFLTSAFVLLLYFGNGLTFFKSRWDVLALRDFAHHRLDEIPLSGASSERELRQAERTLAETIFENLVKKKIMKKLILLFFVIASFSCSKEDSKVGDGLPYFQFTQADADKFINSNEVGKILIYKNQNNTEIKIIKL